MTIENSIFGLRFSSNVSLQPTPEELRKFLESPIHEGGRELHGSVLATYNEVLESVLAFRQRQPPDAPTRNERERLFYGVLSHSFFYNTALKFAVEQYKYQLHALKTIDFRKPRAFINAAELALRSLDPGKKADTVKKVKIQDMVDQRIKLLDTLNNRCPALAEELGHIALYIRDNLFKIANRCETSIVILVNSSIARIKVNQLIEDINLYFKEQLEDGLHGDLVAGQNLENAKTNLARLSKELSDNFREYIFALTQLYESIYDHTLKTARDIDALMGEHLRSKTKSLAEEVELFTRIERVLDTFITRRRFELNAAETKSETTHKDIFLEKRKEMLDHLFELMQKDRRSWLRRSREMRRRSDEISYQYPGRRIDSDRRAGNDRRKELILSA